MVYGVQHLIVAFVVGFFVGMIMGVGVDHILNKAKKKKGGVTLVVDNYLRPIIAITVLIIWVVAVLVSVFNSEFTVGLEIHTILGAIVGALFGNSVLREAKNGKK